MTLARLVEAADRLGCPLSDAQVARFERFRSLLVEWNSRINLTAIRDPDAIESLHFIDSLAGLLALPPTVGLTVVDVGTGGGLPGIALRLARPDLRVTLLDATGKKTSVLAEIADQLGLLDRTDDGGAPIAVLTGRAEEIGQSPQHRECWDVAVARGLAPLPVLAELCLPLVRVGGLVVAWKKRDVDDEIAVTGRGASILGGRRLSSLPVDLPGLPSDRQLVRLAKERPTPARYPRRPGVPKQSPLV